MRQALDALGPDADHTALARWLEERVGEQLRAAGTLATRVGWFDYVQYTQFGA